MKLADQVAMSMSFYPETVSNNLTGANCCCLVANWRPLDSNTIVEAIRCFWLQFQSDSVIKANPLTQGLIKQSDNLYLIKLCSCPDPLKYSTWKGSEKFVLYKEFSGIPHSHLMSQVQGWCIMKSMTLNHQEQQTRILENADGFKLTTKH